VSSVTSRDGTTIAFDRTRSGPPIVLVGGAIQHRAIDPRTAELADRLAQGFTVVHYDRRGRGDSGDTMPYAVEREVEDIEALIEEAGGSASLFGMSSGAVLTLEAAAHGLPIPRLALYEPPFVVDDTRPPVPEDYVDQLARMVAEGRRGDAVAFFLTAGVGMPAETVAPFGTRRSGRRWRASRTRWPTTAS
jgi:pimeloyl-ACP methyl ester carboxylesterase